MRFQVVLHEGVVNEALQPTLAAGIRAIHVEHFGGSPEGLEVDFMEIRRGHMFTAGKLSTSSVVAGQVPAGTSREDRTALLSAITSLWCEVTGCAPDQIVVSAGDAPG